MQTHIAQIIALTIHGNATLRGRAVPAFFPDHSTCTFCKTVGFVRVQRLGEETVELRDAATPDEWFVNLHQAGVRGLWLHYGSRKDPHISDRASVAFVGGGGRWVLEARSAEQSAYWESRWQAGDRQDPERRIWNVTYGRIAVAPLAPSPQVVKLQAMADTLARILPRIARFAREHSLESFAQSFDTALACLRSDQPLQAAFHRDIAPRGSLSLQAEQLLGAAQAAWVFGGMGSWNDLSFEGKAGERYTQLSDALYHHLNLAAVAAADTSFGGQDTG